VCATRRRVGRRCEQRDAERHRGAQGSVAAFIANAKILESLAPTDALYAEVEAQLRALVPAVRAVGVLDVFAPRTAGIAHSLAR